MSRNDPSVRGGPTMTKLKEGLQEVVVFLQTLGSYKIPAVIEKRRKELLERLSLLQGGTVKKDVSEPRDETVSHEERSSTLSKEKILAVKDESENVSPTPSISPRSSKALNRRDSLMVSGLVKDYETIHHDAKKEEENETPKWLVTLKRVAKPTDFPAVSSDDECSTQTLAEVESNPQKPAEVEMPNKKTNTDEEVMEYVSANKTKPAKLEVNSLKSDTLSIASGVDSLEEECEGDGKEIEKKKKSKLGFSHKMKGLIKREKSPAPERRNKLKTGNHSMPDATDGSQEAEDQSKVEEAEEQLEEGVRISGVLERMKKKGKKYKSFKVTVYETRMIFGDKEELELSRCSVETTDLGFDLTHPQHKSAFMFRVDGEDKERQKWATALRDAIQKATPIVEEAKVEDVVKQVEATPSISIEEVADQPSGNKKSKRDSKFATIKPEKKLPDQGVTMKGYLHRKKPGLARNWEKTYGVLTYQALYFTTEGDNREYTNMISISPDMDFKLDSKKGRNADSLGIDLKMGKKVEHLSFDNQDECTSWRVALEKVLGLGVEELLSEDEEAQQELYEELELEEEACPPLPSSTRPPLPSFSAPPIPFQQEDSFAIDEDIYEDTDEILPSQPPPQVPSLPSRNPPKASTNIPVPSLPPRNAPSSPKLPPRASGGKPIPQEYESTDVKSKPAVKPPIATSEDDDGELYDDIVLGGEEPEMYDDIFTGGHDVEEELYDDVVTAMGENKGEPVMDEFYEDMTPGSVSDSYVAMEKPEEMDELYVDVEEPDLTSSKKVQDTPSPQSSLTKKMFKKLSSSNGGNRAAALSGNISYKAPKKSKFEDRWGALEGNNLCIYKTSSDKRSQDKISLGDCRLDIGSTEAGAGKFAFSLSKGDKFYHMSLRDKEELSKWVDVLKGIVKYAPVQVEARVEEEEDVYKATQDHIASTSNELTFKKGTYIILQERESTDVWYGHFRDDPKKKGRFPVSKVQLAEGLYI